MRNVKSTFVVTVLAVAAFGAPAAMARPRAAGVHMGAHARAMSQIYQANQQHSAVIDQVQRNINSNQHGSDGARRSARARRDVAGSIHGATSGGGRGRGIGPGPRAIGTGALRLDVYHPAQPIM